MNHRSLGRVWILADSLEENHAFRILLVDGDNDGELDGPPVVNPKGRARSTMPTRTGTR